jgi:hypothetical protein
MKKDEETIKLLVEELQKVPIVSVACEKVGISRQTFYRWQNKDLKFRNRMKNAIRIGDESISDLCESKIVELIKEKNFPAARYWLNNRSNRFKRDKRIEELEKRYDLAISKQKPSESSIRRIMNLVDGLHLLKDTKDSKSISEKIEYLRKIKDVMKEVDGEDI